MPRYAAKVDINQPDIISSLRAVGALVQPLHGVGKGCPDLLVGFRNKLFLIEVKNGDAPKGDQKLTTDQEKWHLMWAGYVHIARDKFEAIKIIMDGTKT